jgi:membrane-associated protease RseP (regulator of RpoE activity)
LNINEEQDDKSHIIDQNITIKRKEKDKYFLHILLLIVTFLTTTIAGVVWLNIEDIFNFRNFELGLPYSISLLFILLSHEMGHYFASKYHKVDTTLPFLIPFPSIPPNINFGTLGAIIRTRERVRSKKAMFDVGAYGPLAGFVACLIVLIWGFTHLPGKEYLYHIHPEYAITGLREDGLTFGNNLLYSALAKIFVNPQLDFLPPMNEIYHYPFLCVGWFGLFVTAMNLIPSGQLDGGHILYAMFGSRIHKIIARITCYSLLLFGMIGLLSLLNNSYQFGWPGWIVWSLIILFVIKLDHPEVEEQNEPLDAMRIRLGWICFIIFIVSFPPIPFSLY